MVITDISGELYSQTSGYLKSKGYKIYILNTENLDESIGYKCDLSDDGELGCNANTNEITAIICKNCDKNFKYDDFESINFN